MILELLTYDPGVPCDSPQVYADAVIREVEASWNAGADLVLLPEFTWMGLEPMVQADSAETLYPALSALFWDDLLPDFQERLARPGKAVVLGTVPFYDPATHLTFNRAPIFCEGQMRFQDKLHLTPWEKDFNPGGMLNLWQFSELRIAVIICLDIEIPEISARLRGDEVDLILCPSATETLLGVERVNRCASARAVELGCHVAVAHLTGEAKSELVDQNVGRLAFYSPSQAAFKNTERALESDIWSSGLHRMRVTAEKRPLTLMRRMRVETNPSHFGKEAAGHFSIQVEES